MSKTTDKISAILTSMGFTDVTLMFSSGIGWHFSSDQCENVFIGQNKNQSIWLLSEEDMASVLKKLAGLPDWQINNILHL